MKALWLIPIMACFAHAENRINIPEEIEERHPIVAILEVDLPEVPENETIRIKDPIWEYPDTLRSIQVKPDTLHIWADTGTHKLSCSAIWIHSRTRLIAGEKVNEFVDAGYIRVTTSFKVNGVEPPLPPRPDPEPEPDPEPDPEPEGPYQIMLFENRADSDNYTLQQNTILSGRLFREQLVEKGHLFQGVKNVKTWERCVNGVCTVYTPPELTSWYSYVHGKELPRAVYLPVSGGSAKDFYIGPTMSKEDFFKELEK